MAKRSKLKRILSRLFCVSAGENARGDESTSQSEKSPRSARQRSPRAVQDGTDNQRKSPKLMANSRPSSNRAVGATATSSSSNNHESLSSLKDENQLEREGTIVSLSKVEVISGEPPLGSNEDGVSSGGIVGNDTKEVSPLSTGPGTGAGAGAGVVGSDGGVQVIAQVAAGPHDPAESSFYISDAELSDSTKKLSLLGPIDEKNKGKKCLVLDLDETLVHSSFKYTQQADFVISVEIDGQYQDVYVIKRPGVDEFMRRTGELFEIVVFTASVSKYGNPLLDTLDVNNVVDHRLFRDSCFNHRGNYVKHLGRLGRPLQDIIIIDNSPISYIFQPEHAIPVSSWFSDVHDNELLDMLPFLEDLAGGQVPDIRLALDVNI